MFNMFGDRVDPAGEFADYYLRVRVGFADGRKATNLERRWDFDDGPAPDPPALRLVRWEATTCCPGRSRVGLGACRRRSRWPSSARGRSATSPKSRAEVDAGLVVEAAGRGGGHLADQLRR
jgi:hypothetical protein